MRSPSLSPLHAVQGSFAPTNGTPAPNSNADALPVPDERLTRVKQRIEAACRAAGRETKTVRLLAVSKTFAADEVRALRALGQQAFGENYLQEALDKIAATQGTGIEWHFIGPIQSNKTRPIAEHFDWVHSVDRLKIATRLSEQRPAGLPPLQVCLQVDVSDEDTKSGCVPAEAPALAAEIASLPRLQIRGLMAIPAPTTDPAQQRRQFRKVREIFEAVRCALPSPAVEAFDTLSMGMSGDLEAAIAEGSTVVRVGTALFGARSARP